MKAASLNELKKELVLLEAPQLAELCLGLARYKKDNKELLSYLLFDAHDVPAYISTIKEEVALAFSEINQDTPYYIKKGLRKILRLLTKHIRFIGEKFAEAELLIHFCMQMKSSGIPIRRHKLIANIYDQQLVKIEKAIASLHEDLQYDYRQELHLLI
jgi:hypothetical protein